MLVGEEQRRGGCLLRAEDALIWFPSMPAFGLHPSEWKQLKSLRGPERIQRFLDEEIAYNTEPNGPTCYSPRLVLRYGRAHCMEGALLAAAALRLNGHPPLLLNLESVRDDNHALALFRHDHCYGAITKSNYAGLRYREPVYRTLRELVMSYFEHYYNVRGEKTLRAFSTRPIDLARFDHRGWMSSEQQVWYISDYLSTVRHTRLLTPNQERRRMWMDRRLFEAGQHGSVGHDSCVLGRRITDAGREKGQDIRRPAQRH